MNKYSEPLLLLININYYFCIKFKNHNLFPLVKRIQSINFLYT